MRQTVNYKGWEIRLSKIYNKSNFEQSAWRMVATGNDSEIETNLPKCGFEQAEKYAKELLDGISDVADRIFDPKYKVSKKESTKMEQNTLEHRGWEIKFSGVQITTNIPNQGKIVEKHWGYKATKEDCILTPIDIHTSVVSAFGEVIKRIDEFEDKNDVLEEEWTFSTPKPIPYEDGLYTVEAEKKLKGNHPDRVLLEKEYSIKLKVTGTGKKGGDNHNRKWKAEAVAYKIIETNGERNLVPCAGDVCYSDKPDHCHINAFNTIINRLRKKESK